MKEKLEPLTVSKYAAVEVVQSKFSRDYSVVTKVELVEILYFKHFYEHFTFGETDWSKRGKRLEKYVRVAIAIELVTVGTKLEDL